MSKMPHYQWTGFSSIDGFLESREDVLGNVQRLLEVNNDDQLNLNCAQGVSHGTTCVTRGASSKTLPTVLGIVLS